MQVNTEVGQNKGSVVLVVRTEEAVYTYTVVRSSKPKPSLQEKKIDSCEWRRFGIRAKK